AALGGRRRVGGHRERGGARARAYRQVRGRSLGLRLLVLVGTHVGLGPGVAEHVGRLRTGCARVRRSDGRGALGELEVPGGGIGEQGAGEDAVLLLAGGRVQRGLGAVLGSGPHIFRTGPGLPDEVVIGGRGRRRGVVDAYVPG